ncbi:MAG: CPBP family intramembrane metalloprotease [Phycisphaerales bacterium]|nr:MAG: CPBP family intramembrane metalloprotease [Phycisphaerales bacterium]
MNNDVDTEQHSLLKSILLHFMPAIIWLICYIPLARISSRTNIPTMFVMYLLVAVVLVPTELGYLYSLGKRRSGRFTLEGIVFFRESIPWWQYVVFGLIIAIWIVLVFFGIGEQLAKLFKAHIFFWVPDWFLLNRGVPEQNGPFVETTMWVFGLIFIGLIGPLTEELYFRGYLLPRLSRFRIWAPLLNVVLFSAYHFWQPHYCVVTVIAMLPLVYCVWWKKNIYLGVGVHCFLNTLGWLIEFIQRLGSSPN